ncbi:MAG: NADH:flavin oxidoreductase, partial [Desulfobacterales bacterium]
MARLFEPTQIKGMKMKNRFVRSATYTALAELDGTVTDRLPDFMAELARGEVGLIITGHAYVTREGQAGPRQLGIHSNALIAGLKRLTAAVHDNASVVAIQLAHAGKKGIGKGTYAALGPSDVFEEGEKKASAMTIDDIQRTITAFGDAAERAVESGFDAVQIHAAHGYLLSQFLSPYSNKRTDGYAGTLANRSRLLLDVYAEIRRRVGASCPVLAKINSEDFLEGGFTVAEMLEVAHMLEDRGLDAIE